MKALTIILALFCSANSLGAVKYVEGEGRFYVREKDSAEFVNSQLLYFAFRDVVNKELRSLGLDAKLFWSKYEEQFETWFAPIGEKMKEKKVEGQELRELLRFKRLSSMAKFGGINQVIKSYVEKKYTRSTKNPRSRYLRISATVDRKALGKLYFRFVSSKGARIFSKLYLSVNIRLKGKFGEEAGVEVGGYFVDAVVNHWKKWMEENFKESVRVVEVAMEGEGGGMRTHLKELARRRGRVHTAMDIPLLEQEGGGVFSPGASFRDSLWLMLDIDLKTSFAKRSDERLFSFSGGIVVLDLNTGDIVFHADLPLQEKSYPLSNPDKLVADLAGWVWNRPLKEFKVLQQKLASIPYNTQAVNLQVGRVRSILDLYGFTKLLASKGLRIHFRPQILSYRGTQGVVRLGYRGSIREVIRILQGLNRKRLGNGRVVYLASRDNPFSFIFKRADSG